MADLNTLRPEVQAAMRELREALRVQGVGSHGPQFTIISAELRRLARYNDALRSKCNVIMSGSTQHLGRAERAEAELAALKARIAEAPMAVVQSAPGAIKASFHGYGCFEYTAENLQPRMRGRSVRLLVEE